MLTDSGGMDVNQRQRMIDRFHAKRTSPSIDPVERAVACHVITSLLYMASVRTTNAVSHRVREWFPNMTEAS